MRTDKQLADALVERGILESQCCSDAGHCSYALAGDEHDPIGYEWPETIVNDWRVAGACMGRLSEIEVTGQMKEQLPAK